MILLCLRFPLRNPKKLKDTTMETSVQHTAGTREHTKHITLFRNPFSMEAAFTDTDLGIRMVFSKMTGEEKKRPMQDDKQDSAFVSVSFKKNHLIKKKKSTQRNELFTLYYWKVDS